MMMTMNENREIKKDDARPIKNSGRGFQKGDAIINDRYLVDYKNYTKSFSINLNKWHKHALDSIEAGFLTPCFGVTLNDGDDNVKVAIIPWDEFMRLQESYNGEG